MTCAPIGEDYGFGGHVSRLDVMTSAGPRSVVAKEETRNQIERIAGAYLQMAPALKGRVPELYAWGEEFALFELVAPATQGDGLRVEPWQVEPLIRLLADLHDATWSDEPGMWAPDHWEIGRWEARLDVAEERYPHRITKELRDRLIILHDEMPGAISSVSEGPSALIHMDSGYDNTLWRPDGSIVLLDWSEARRGPPTFDLAAHLTDSTPEHAIDVYVNRLRANGRGVTTNEVVAGLQHSARLFVRGMVGAAGKPGEPSQPRLEEFRDGALDVAMRTLDWIDESTR